MLATLLTILVLAIVHLVAGTTAVLGLKWGPRALSRRTTRCDFLLNPVFGLTSHV